MRRPETTLPLPTDFVGQLLPPEGDPPIDTAPPLGPSNCSKRVSLTKKESEIAGDVYIRLARNGHLRLQLMLLITGEHILLVQID